MAEPVVPTPAEPRGIVVCDESAHPHTRDGNCTNPKPAVHTPGAGMELLRREHPEMVPDITDAEAEAIKERFREAMRGPQALVVLPPTEDERERAAYERGKAESQGDVHADVIVPCRDTREDLDGALCTGEVRYRPSDIQAKCTVCGGWRGRYAPAALATYEQGIAEGRRQATEGWERRWGVGNPPDVKPCQDEDDARGYADLPGWGPAVSRLVGPWEPAPRVPDLDLWRQREQEAGLTRNEDGRWEPAEQPEPAPPGAGYCAKCGEWDRRPDRFPLCPSCGQPWTGVVEQPEDGAR